MPTQRDVTCSQHSSNQGSSVEDITADRMYELILSFGADTFFEAYFDSFDEANDGAELMRSKGAKCRVIEIKTTRTVIATDY
jgi:hypothetical protein